MVHLVPCSIVLGKPGAQQLPRLKGALPQSLASAPRQRISSSNDGLLQDGLGAYCV